MFNVVENEWFTRELLCFFFHSVDVIHVIPLNNSLLITDKLLLRIKQHLMITTKQTSPKTCGWNKRRDKQLAKNMRHK